MTQFGGRKLLFLFLPECLEIVPMIHRKLIGCSLILLISMVLALFSIASRVAAGRVTGPTARGTTMSRQAIKQTPILERPGRPGHVYGNTVRRRHNRQSHRR